MRFEDFVYPPYGMSLAEAYGGRFESAFVVLHPFIRMPEQMAWKITRQYPDDRQITAIGTRYRWADVGIETALSSCARINQALLTSTGALKGDMAYPYGSDVLRHYLESGAVWMPSEGRFEPLLQQDFVRVFEAAAMEELVFVPEFADAQPVVRLSIAELQDGSIPFPVCGTLLAPDASFLFTVDWDSFFTLFYGSRAFIEEVTRSLRVEGFFATGNTEHAWWNYSMGCATVTVSPEDWQNV